MNPTVRLDDQVYVALQQQAVKDGMVFATPNAVLRKMLKLDQVTNLVQPGESGEITLYLNAPYYTGKTKFDVIISTNIAPGYVLYPSILSRLKVPDNKVVLVAKDKRNSASGRITEIIPVGKTPRGKQRFDIRVDEWTPVDFEDVNFNYCGVAIK